MYKPVLRKALESMITYYAAAAEVAGGRGGLLSPWNISTSTYNSYYTTNNTLRHIKFFGNMYST